MMIRPFYQSAPYNSEYLYSLSLNIFMLNFDVNNSNIIFHFLLWKFYASVFCYINNRDA